MRSHTLSNVPAWQKKVLGDDAAIEAAALRELDNGIEGETVEISDAAWERGRGPNGQHSPIVLRNAIATAAGRLLRGAAKPNGGQRGTVMFAGRDTPCPVCGETVREGMVMVNACANGSGIAEALHPECAHRLGIEPNVGAKFQEGLARQLGGIR